MTARVLQPPDWPRPRGYANGMSARGRLICRHDYLANAAALGAVYREILGRHYPAMTAVQVVALIEPGAVVEIEATAVVPDEPAL